MALGGGRRHPLQGRSLGLDAAAVQLQQVSTDPEARRAGNAGARASGPVPAAARAQVPASALFVRADNVAAIGLYETVGMSSSSTTAACSSDGAASPRRAPRRVRAERQGSLNGDPGVACPLTEVGRAQARALGAALADEQIDLCVVTEFERVRETAEIALAGRDVPFPRPPGAERPALRRVRGRARSSRTANGPGRGPRSDAPGGGRAAARSRAATPRAPAPADRPEDTILVVAHSLPLALPSRDAAAGDRTAEPMDVVEYATCSVPRVELAAEVERLERGSQKPGLLARRLL